MLSTQCHHADRRLALLLHPDKNQGASAETAAEKFKEVTAMCMQCPSSPWCPPLHAPIHLGAHLYMPQSSHACHSKVAEAAQAHASKATGSKAPRAGQVSRAATPVCSGPGRMRRTLLANALWPSGCGRINVVVYTGGHIVHIIISS